MPARRLSARTYLFGLVAAAIVPVWIFAAYVLISFALSQQQAYRDRAVEFAQQSAANIDSELRDMLVRIDGLARSSAFERGDLSQVHRDAQRLVAGTDSVIVLRDVTGRQLLNTSVPFGKPLPPTDATAPDQLASFVEGKEKIVSNVFLNPLAGDHRIAVARPVTLQDGSSALLAITVPLITLHRAIVREKNDGWIVGVADKNGVYVTRSELHDEVAGKPGLPSYLEKAVGKSGVFTSVNQFGDHLLAGYYRSDLSGWLFAANVRVAVVEAPLWRSILSVVAIGAVALAVSLLAAFSVGRMFTRETRDIAQQALALGEGKRLQPVNTHFAEFDLISEAFLDADAMIRERTSELEAVLDTVPVAVWFTYDAAGRQVIRNRHATELMGLPSENSKPFGSPGEVIDTVALKDGEIVTREDRPLTKAMRGEVTDHEEFLYRLPSGAELVLLSSARPIFDATGVKVVGAVQVSIDITERKRAETQRRLLTKELDHRVKNNLAIVQALVHQTLRNSENLADAQADIGARLVALANAHDILTRNAWIEGDLRATIESTVLTQAPPERVNIEGRAVSLAPNQVMVVSLAMHELTTNAVKYGALSNQTGTVSISWTTVEREGPRLVVRWIEKGGPPVSEPTKRGFGSRLLERLTQGEGGSAKRSFDYAGLTCTIELPLNFLADSANH